ncbi:MAG: YfhO family protein [Chloroflexi bacterium]|nr:YfhO family protein [Chloroflexota bacterium]
MRRYLPLLTLAALVLLFLRQAAFTNLIFARGDTLLYFYPYWDYRAQSLLAGRLPLWNPFLFMGVPFLANSQAGVFYPLNWPLMFFSAPVALKISIVVHLIIAAWGAYTLARKVFELESFPATFAAAVFALGGYLLAQIEHVNQLQGLAWLPLALLFTYKVTQPGKPATLSPLHLVILSLLIALQLTAGHTQTAFITLVACGLVALQCTILNAQFSMKKSILSIVNWALGIALAFGLAAIQLFPTFELSRLSLRGGGLPLNEAVSFSLNPLLLGRALLPGYSRILFSEFVGYVGVIPLFLAAFALTDLRRNRNVQLAAVLAGVGLFFAIGGYNPFYLLLAKFVPGFNLFRVPARWLVLGTLGSAILAGYGLQAISNQKSKIKNWALISLSPLLLISLSFLSANLTPPGELGPIGLPAPLDLALWLAPLALSFVVSRFTQHAIRNTQYAISLLAIVELLIASTSLPLNHLTTPDAYASIRPAMTQLLAAKTETVPLARFLSLSALEFDPGDLAELHSEWDSQLPPEDVYDAIIATKHKEVLSPNLPLTWQVPAVDGYDGGILPLRQYAEFAANFGPVPAQTDGRLRQLLTAVPPNWLLNLTNTRWIITDKTGDAWVDNIFYDLQSTFTVTPDEPLTLGHIPNFQATALGLVLTPDSVGGTAHITFDDGSTANLLITNNQNQPALRLPFDRPSRVTALTLTSDSSLTVRGASLIDERADAFQSLTLGPYRLAHSGDVKIYENLNVLPRAFIVSNLCKGETCFAPALAGTASVLKYEAEHVVVQTTTDTPGQLILTDTDYPGWLATVDGQPAEITKAYGLFRAVAIPAGAHTIAFHFQPTSLKVGAIITIAGLLVLTGLLLYSSNDKRQTTLHV